MFSLKKTKIAWLPRLIIRLAVSIQCPYVTDEQTDGQTDILPRFSTNTLIYFGNDATYGHSYDGVLVETNSLTRAAFNGVKLSDLERV